MTETRNDAANYPQQTVAELKRKLAERTAERDDLLQQQTATAEVLKVISNSAFDLDSVLGTLVELATPLCEAERGMIYLRKSDQLHMSANFGFPAELEAFARTNPLPMDGDSTTARAASSGMPVQTVDILADETQGELALRYQQLGGHRCRLGVPLRRDGQTIGVFTLIRHEARAFTDKQIELIQTFADQAVIAIENVRLFGEVQARTNDLAEALAYQTGSANILNVIASSPTNLEPVLQAIVESACQLCEAHDAVVRLKIGDKLQIGAHRGPIPTDDMSLINRNWTAGRAVIDKKPVHVRDMLSPEGDEFPETQRRAREKGHRTVLSVPLLRAGESVGAIVLRRTEMCPFSDKQITLLQTFADQAVIAIGNVRMFDQVQAKTRDLGESLQQQTATSDVLKVISRSAFDLDSVMNTLTRSAAELCDAEISALYLREGDVLVVRGITDMKGAKADFLQRTPLQVNSSTYVGRAILTGSLLNIADVETEADVGFLKRFAEVLGFKAILFVPLMREGRGIGVFALGRERVGQFSQREVHLVQTFADQAVIAIENTRLFNETKEALEQQKASAEILSVISHSVADTQPVFNKILESCKHLFGGDELDVLLVDEQGQLNIAAYIGESHDIVAATFPAPVDRTPAGRAIRERRVMHWPDLVNGEDVPGVLRKMAKLIGYRSMVFAPMLWEDRGIGAIGVARSMGPFKAKELAMLQTFADQAVIAIQNARLFNETKEALERQTATADILKVIASSPSDVQPIFEAIAESSNRLVGGLSTAVVSIVGDMMHLEAFTPTGPAADAALQALFPAPLAAFVWGETICKGEIVRITDSEIYYATRLSARDVARLRGWRSALYVPLLRGETLIGMISVTRVQPGPFDDRHVKLLQTFADQAVIAISNVDLFQEVKERTRELSQSLDDLRTAQDRLVQTEKLASLGQLTAGIAHEIKNPLNFVNNFSSLSAELVDELDETLAPAPLDQKMRGDVDELTQMLKSNLEKVVQHGKRADSIVKNMLLHSREGSGEHRSADINALVEESVNLAYHGSRAEKPGFDITLKRDFDPDAGAVELYPQEITRVLLNLISNGFYATTKRKEAGDQTFEPALSAVTKNLGNRVEIRIRDNGIGMPPEVKDKIFNPFFTTKPAGEGTGLGLSMSHDIIVKQHGGKIDVETEPGVFTEFTIILPRKSNNSKKI